MVCEWEAARAVSDPGFRKPMVLVEESAHLDNIIYQIAGMLHFLDWLNPRVSGVKSLDLASFVHGME